MKKKFFVKPTLSVKTLNVREAIVASIEIDKDNGYIGGSYATTYYKRDIDGNVLTGNLGTQENGCYEVLTNIENIDLSVIGNNWDFNRWVLNVIFGNLPVSQFNDAQKTVYRACCHFE